MKLNDVSLDGGYLVIHTDEGTRKQSLNWRGVGPLRAKAVSLIGKNIRTTTAGAWDPLIWFATIEEVLPASSSSNLSTPEVGTEIEFSVVAHRNEKIQVSQSVTDTLTDRVPIGNPP